MIDNCDMLKRYTDSTQRSMQHDEYDSHATGVNRGAPCQGRLFPGVSLIGGIYSDINARRARAYRHAAELQVDRVAKRIEKAKADRMTGQ